MVGAFVILLIALWALGLITSYTLGGFIHILLLGALAGLVFLMRQGRRF
ncbi:MULTISPECIES: lmo0937 family membrane protein [unclassified Pseudomonas]|nr:MULTISPECIES: lmo0937 family membrane protein [unclassified Pseudomonas]AYF86790.1 lmo0937 family membrane protein [Pseudomonas sp. DY-1]MDH4652199.1 lmo0937 family membrane protein [Pseudomonas sp. BN606]MRK21894.1 lmo0937 family membrane protein [Pseudomonas sp. JG-B]